MEFVERTGGAAGEIIVRSFGNDWTPKALWVIRVPVEVVAASEAVLLVSAAASGLRLGGVPLHLRSTEEHEDWAGPVASYELFLDVGAGATGSAVYAIVVASAKGVADKVARKLDEAQPLTLSEATSRAFWVIRERYGIDPSVRLTLVEASEDTHGMRIVVQDSTREYVVGMTLMFGLVEVTSISHRLIHPVGFRPTHHK